MKTVLKQITAVAVLALSAAAASAIQYDTFGSLPDLKAGGSINGNVAITQVGDLTLGLTAQQRYFNPAVTTDGAGTFFAGTGQNNGLGSSAYQGALWNFDFYIKNAGTTPLSYKLSYGLAGNLLYSFNPAADADADDYTAGTLQDSQNLLFANFGGAANGFNTFNPNANADYEFLLEARNDAGALVGASSIIVRVGTGSPVPDAGSTLALMGTAMAGLVGLRRKFAV